MLKSWSIRLSCFQFVTAFYLLAFNSTCTAQILPDGSLPINSVVEDGVNSTKIISGGTTSGNNLFHSFEQFTIPTGGSAYFNNAVDIQNIFSRVTGNSVSKIDGTLRANGNANLFLLNHNGIVFGPNATLNIGGSFLATTARTISFSDGTQFSTNIAQTTPLLTVSVPSGLNLDSGSGEISVQGAGHSLVGQFGRPVFGTNQTVGLRTQTGKNLILVGGDVTLEAGILTAPGGRVEIGSVKNGTVNLNSNSNTWNLDYTQISNFKDIRLSTRALIDASGFGSGSIQLQGGKISFIGGSVAIVQNQGLLDSGGITLNASDSIEISGTDPIARIPGSIRSETLTSGKGGDILIYTPSLTLTEGGGINTVTYADGAAGNITLKVPDSIQIIGSSPRSSITQSNVSSATLSFGKAGNILVQTGSYTAKDGGSLLSSTSGNGAGGNIQIDANKSIELLGYQPNTLAPTAIGATTFGIGDAGEVVINTSKLLLENGGRIDSSTIASGNANSISITASDSVEVKGQVPNSLNPSLIISSGNILDPVLRASFGATNTFNLTGDSGNVKITTNKLTVTDGGLISVNNQGTGNAGDTEVFAHSIFLDNNGGITAATSSGQGGKVFIQSEQLQLNNSNVTTTAGNRGNGGNIVINTDTLVGLENSNITAQAFEGNGGNIRINTQGLFLSSDSIISASSERGVNGVVDTQILGFDVTHSLIPLNNNLITPEQVIAGSCLARRNSQQGSFVVTGSGGLPISPYSNIESWDNSIQGQSQSNNPTPPEKPSPVDVAVTPKSWQPGDPIVEAQTLIITADGRGLLTTTKQAQLADPKSLICAAEQAELPAK